MLRLWKTMMNMKKSKDIYALACNPYGLRANGGDARRWLQCDESVVEKIPYRE